MINQSYYHLLPPAKHYINDFFQKIPPGIVKVHMNSCLDLELSSQCTQSLPPTTCQLKSKGQNWHSTLWHLLIVCYAISINQAFPYLNTIPLLSKYTFPQLGNVVSSRN